MKLLDAMLKIFLDDPAISGTALLFKEIAEYFIMFSTTGSRPDRRPVYSYQLCYLDKMAAS